MAITDEKILFEGRRALQEEINSLMKLRDSLGQEFIDAVFAILNTPGNVIFSGVGKSGHIGRKLAATFSSTGTRAFFVHSCEAAHGDLGMIGEHDIFIGISQSGESDELTSLLPSIKKMHLPIIAMTGNSSSTLAKFSDVILSTSVDREACPLNLAPTSSTTVALALGDALASALMVARNFDSEDFARSHPAGALGRRLTLSVKDVMRVQDLPVVSITEKALDAIKMMAKSHLGSFVVVQDKKPIGIFTEGDLTRGLERGLDFSSLSVGDIMKNSPKSVKSDILAFAALRQINELNINQLLVVDDNDDFVGIVHVQDLLANRL